MRAYIGVTASEIQEFLQSGEFDVSDAYAATPTFISSNSDLDEEEVEYTLSLIAAEDAVELLGSAVGTACVLALEVPQSLKQSMNSQSHFLHLCSGITCNAVLRFQLMVRN